MKCSFGVSDFLEEISSLSHSVVFLYFFALIAEKCFIISSCYSLELCIQMFISFHLKRSHLKFPTTQDRLDCIICGYQCKMKSGVPCSKISKNFKMAVSKPETKAGAPPGASHEADSPSEVLRQVFLPSFSSSETNK